jgi:MFS family permease
MAREIEELGGGRPEFKLSSLTFTVYLPTILFSIGQGAVIPVIPLFARELGSSVAAAALVVAMRGLGQLFFDIPAGVAVTKWGDKGAMVAGTAMIGLVAVGAAFSPTPLVLALLVFVMGGGWAFWQVARLAYVSEQVPLAQRGRAISMTGGMNRVGNFIGPVVGGSLGSAFGLEAAFIAQAVLGLAASATMFMVVAEGRGSENLELHGIGSRLAQTVVDHRKVFLAAGFPMMALGLLRQARQVFLPLWGDEIGLSVAQIGVVTSMSFFIDAAVFYPIGSVMDRFGRKWAAVPCLSTLALGLVLLPLTSGFGTFLMIAFLTGVGNGFGAGINMTLGADFAPDVGRGEFLGVWRLLADVGQAGGPAIISVITGISSLAAASVVSGGIGFVGAAILLAFMPETLKKSEPAVVPVVPPG